MLLKREAALIIFIHEHSNWLGASKSGLNIPFQSRLSNCPAQIIHPSPGSKLTLNLHIFGPRLMPFSLPRMTFLLVVNLSLFQVASSILGEAFSNALGCNLSLLPLSLLKPQFHSVGLWSSSVMFTSVPASSTQDGWFRHFCSCMASSFSSFRYWLKSHLLSQAFLDHLIKSNPHPYPLCLIILCYLSSS